MPAKFNDIIKYCENCGNPLVLKCTRDIERKRFCSRNCLGSFSLKNNWKDIEFANKVKCSHETKESNIKKGKGGRSHKGKKHSIEWKEHNSLATSQLILENKLNNKSKYKTGYITNIKIINKDNTIYFRSSYEEKFIYDMVANTNISTILNSPFYLKYQEGKRYIPDFLLTTTKQEKILIEIKPNSLLGLPINQIKFKAAKSYCNINNIQFEIITEDQLFNNGGYKYA